MRSLLPIAAILLAPLAHAQILSVYGTYNPTHSSNVQTGVLSTSSGYQDQYTSFWSNGFGGGVTFGVLPFGPIRIGLDFRGSTKPGNNGADTALGGIKVGIKLPVIPLKPWT